ncbi:MAG: OmpH family outer membrane protein [Proteobacteria bacterium]|nr:OmpH family outer membrane protein [Pseudomonadota bacterium]
MRKQISIIVSGFALLMAASVAVAEAVKIGVVDVQAIVQQSEKAKVIRDKLKAQFKSREQEIMAAEKKFQDDVAKLKRNDSVMSQPEKTKMEQMAYDEKRNLQRLEEDYQQDLNFAQNKAMESFFAELKKSIDKVAKDGNYDLVLQRGAVPYANPRIDITAQVLKDFS